MPIRQRGSHVSLTNGKISIVVPLHNELDKGTLHGILEDAGVKRKEFMKYL
jgi:predicted RNA binding protein YcfA (HicA-like mRNA interferase family)